MSTIILPLSIKTHCSHCLFPHVRQARWKFREYNELPHLFRRRCHSSYPFADRYLAQFPRESQAILARFVSFIAGSIAGVLLLASLADPDLFLHFELTPGRNTLFYIGVFGAVLAVARGMVPDERLVFEPEVLLEAVVHHTHYCPPEWSERGFHSAEVNVEFAKLYDLKLAIFVREVLSVLVTPFVLAWALPRSAEDVVDFFREVSVCRRKRWRSLLTEILDYSSLDSTLYMSIDLGTCAATRSSTSALRKGTMPQPKMRT